MTPAPRYLLDACVLYPTVVRQVLTGAAAAGLFQPFWSDRILEEWARATVKLGAGAEVIARGEIAGLRLAFPGASVPLRDEARLWLPDPADVHVLAAAIAARAQAIVTWNAADFPRDILRGEGLDRIDPDLMLLGLLDRDRPAMERVTAAVAAEATRLSGAEWTVPALLKKARLPRLARALRPPNF